MRTTICSTAALAGTLLAAAALADEAEVTIGHNRIEPAEVTIEVGDEVEWTNADEMPGGHKLVADDGSFESPGLGKGESWEHTFAKPGVHAYHIAEHPSAKGRVIVEPDDDDDEAEAK